MNQSSLHPKDDASTNHQLQEVDRKITLKAAVMTCWPYDLSSPLDAIRSIRSGDIEVMVPKSGYHESSWKIVRQYGKRMIHPKDQLRRKMSDGRFETRSVPTFPVVIAMYKPAGYIVTKLNSNGSDDVNFSDGETNASLRSVYDLLATTFCSQNTTVPSHIQQLLPLFRAVGRLDKDTEGILLFTNQGRWITVLTTPLSCIQKVYRCWLLHPATDEDLQSWRNGIQYRHRNSPEGVATSLPAVAVEWGHATDRHVVDVTIVEGKYRQVRRCWEALSNRVVRLLRSSFGPISLHHEGTEQPGQCRLLSNPELLAMEMCVLNGTSGN